MINFEQLPEYGTLVFKAETAKEAAAYLETLFHPYPMVYFVKGLLKQFLEFRRPKTNQKWA